MKLTLPWVQPGKPSGFLAVGRSACLGLPLLRDSGVVGDKAEPIQPCLTVYPPTSALGSLPSVALSSGWAERNIRPESIDNNKPGYSMMEVFRDPSDRGISICGLRWMHLKR